MTDFELTPQLVQKVLDTVDKGLSAGLGSPTPGNMCVEAAVCYAMGLPHGDEPTCVDPVICGLKIALNDANWSSKTSRAAGMRRLAVLQLGTKDCGFNQAEFASKVAAVAVKHAAEGAKYAAEGAKYAAKYAAEYAAKSVKYAKYTAECAAKSVKYTKYAKYAAKSVKYAAECAAEGAKYTAECAAKSVKYAAECTEYAAECTSDDVLRAFATDVENILIEMSVPAVPYLSLSL